MNKENKPRKPITIDVIPELVNGIEPTAPPSAAALKVCSMTFEELMVALDGNVVEVEKARTFCELVEMSTTPDGSIDLMAFDNAPAVGYNGGVKCDVTSGPCSCGAWH